MKPSPFTYHRPESLDEALRVLAEVGADGKVLAGGQSLLPVLSMRLAAPAHLVDVNRLADLAYVRTEPAGVRVGALARHAAVEHDAAAAAVQPLVRQALRLVAHPTIRNRGTTVGSLAHADPGGEMTAVLAVLDGRVTLACDLRPGQGVATSPPPTSSSARSSPPSAPGELAVEAFFPAVAAGRRHGVPRGGPAARRLCGVRRRGRRHARGGRRRLGPAARVRVDGPDACGRSAARRPPGGPPRTRSAGAAPPRRPRRAGAGGRHPRHRRLPAATWRACSRRGRSPRRGRRPARRPGRRHERAGPYRSGSWSTACRAARRVPVRRLLSDALRVRPGARPARTSAASTASAARARFCSTACPCAPACCSRPPSTAAR